MTLDPLLRPRHVVVIGASRQPGGVGRQVLANLARGGFTGRVTVVHPTAREVDGVPCVPSLAALDVAPDLAVLAVPTAQVLPVVTACAARGVRSAVILTAGFREIGAVGAALEQEVVAAARAGGLRLVGPNCLGLCNTDPAIGLQATFAASQVPRGPVALVSQSGAVGLHLIDSAADRGLGLAEFVSIGNGADVHAADLLDRWAADDAVRVIGVYLETLADVPRFVTALDAAARRKPVIVLKAGRSEAGARAAASHTGAMAGRDDALNALLRQHGAFRVQTLDEFTDLARTLGTARRPRGRALAIVGNAGGPGILATDTLAQHGLPLAQLGADTEAALRALLPPAASPRNPVDTIAVVAPSTFERALELVARDPAVGGVIAQVVPVLETQAAPIADAVAAVAARHPALPVLAVLLGREARHAVLDAADVPLYHTPEPAVHAFAAMAWREQWLAAAREPAPALDVDHTAIAATIAAHQAAGTTTLLGEAAFALLRLAGVPCIASALVQHADDAVAAAATMGGRVVLKLVSPDAPHKSDIGGVRLDLRTAADIRAAFAEMTAAAAAHVPPLRVDGILVQPMRAPDRELILGLARDPVVGPVVLAGLGGTQAEALHDVAVRVAPFGPREAVAMLDELQGARLLGAWRGSAPIAKTAVVDVLLRLGALATQHPAVLELDLNPLHAAPDGVCVLDARLTLAPA